MRGAVRSFDQGAGVGEIEGDDGRVFAFHCTAISDGSRTIPVGAAVEFDITPGHLGAWEASEITPS